MKKILLVVLALLSGILLFLLSLRLDYMKTQAAAPATVSDLANSTSGGHALGYAFGALVIPLFFATILTVLKKLFSRSPFDYTLFWSLLIVFGMISSVEKYLEIREKPEVTKSSE